MSKHTFYTLVPDEHSLINNIVYTLERCCGIVSVEKDCANTDTYRKMLTEILNDADDILAQLRGLRRVCFIDPDTKEKPAQPDPTAVKDHPRKDVW